MNTPALEFSECGLAIPNGAVLVTHGLNNKPAVMRQLTEKLLLAGFHCVTMPLAHASADAPAAAQSVRNTWDLNTRSALEQMRSRWPTLPVYGLGYSLGALVLLGALNGDGAAAFQRLVLIAPPIVLSKTAGMIQSITWLANFGVALPSLAPEQVRDRPWTPLTEYQAMILAADQVRKTHVDVLNVPTLVILDSKDELVSCGGVSEWIRDTALTRWTIEQVAPRQRSAPYPHHLIVLKEAVGPDEWDRIAGLVVDHLVQGSQPG